MENTNTPDALKGFVLVDESRKNNKLDDGMTTVSSSTNGSKSSSKTTTAGPQKKQKGFFSNMLLHSKAGTFVIQSPEDEIVILGKLYKKASDEDLEQSNHRLNRSIDSILWFSYRYGFNYNIPNSKLDSDVGWGCMIRCGQMLLAATIMNRTTGASEGYKKTVIGLFQENCDPKAPYGIHNLVQFAEMNFAITAGQWFRATTIMMSLEEMRIKLKPQATNNIMIYTAVDSFISMKDIYSKVFPTGPRLEQPECLPYLRKHEWSSAMLFCVAIRTGLNSPQANFKQTLARLIQMPHSLGFLGGYNKLKSKYYYLDPHYVQESIPNGGTNFDSYAVSNIYEYSYEDMVTSLLPAFFIRDRSDFELFYDEIQKITQEVGEDNMPFSFNLAAEESMQVDEF